MNLKKINIMKIRKFPYLLLQGFFAFLPLIVTVYVGLLIFKIVEGVADNIVPFFPVEMTNRLPFVIAVEIIVVFLFVIALAFFGYLVRTFIGKLIMKTLKSLFSILPGLNAIYRATVQVVSVLSSEKKNFFNHPVLVEYPSPGIWAVAFNTGEIDTNKSLSERRRYTVFIPTTPNPTSGFLAIMTEDKIREFDISAEDAIKLILTGGIVKVIETEGHESR